MAIGSRRRRLLEQVKRKPVGASHVARIAGARLSSVQVKARLFASR